MRKDIQMKNRPFLSYARFAILLALSGLAFWACHLGETNVVEEHVSFSPDLFDSLKAYDKVVIVFSPIDGSPADTVFIGKVDSPERLEGIKVKNWNTGKVLISFEGFMNGAPVYRIEKTYDGKTDRTDGTVVILAPGSLTTPVSDFILAEDDSIPLPVITVKPAAISSQELLWTADKPGILILGATFIKAIKSGYTEVTVALKSDPSKKLILKFTVSANGRIPESLVLSADTLLVAVNGATGNLTVHAVPNSASNAVSWKLDDSTVATVAQDGLVRGLKRGSTKLWAMSKENPAIFDTARVVVSEPIAVESVRFLKSTADLYVRGASEALQVEVLPATANPEVTFTVSDPAKVGLKDGRISGLVEGTAWVVVQSKENSLKKDTLLVTVLPSQIVDSVTISPRSLKLFTGAVSQTLTAKVIPASASPKIQWRSTREDIATVDAAGKVSPVSAGNARILAVSQADSLKRDSVEVTVTRDAPVVSIGKDTVISLGQTVTFLPVVATQEYGVVTQFKWDLDGNSAWDDSSVAVKSVSYKFDLEKEYTVRFYVRDTEGNETVVSKKVKAIGGPVVLIQSPLDNSYTNQALITVDWTIGGVKQDSLTKETLKSGANTITRSARDAVGTLFSKSVTVYLDTVPPSAPKLVGASPTSAMPKWTWSTGGGGTGDFRFRLGDANFPANAPETKLLEYALSTAVSKTAYNLYVEERDAVGNWSAPANLVILYDLSKPTVTFTSPQASGTYLTKAAAMDIAGTSGSPQGPGTIKTLAYTVDGVAGTLATNLAADGSWSIKALPLVKDKTIALKVIATDNIGNTGEATLSLTMDNTAPAPPVFTATPPAIVNKSDLRTSLQWTWTRTDAATDSFLVSLNGSEVSRQTGTSYSVNNPADGNYQLAVVEKDLAGNASTILTGANVLVDRSLPTVPSPGTASPTRDNTPTWTWTSSASGQFEYRLAQNADPTGTGTALAAVTFTPAPANSLADGTWYFQVREKDAADNWSAWSSSSVVVIKASAPNPPSVSRNAATTNAPKWTWSSGGGGNGTYRYRWNGVATYLAEGAATEYTPNLAEGSYNLCVSEKDAIGFGGETCVSIAVDKTAPVIAGYNIADGFITNTSPITVSYTKDGAAESFSCDLADNASTTCSKSVSDAAGNGATVSRKVWYRSNVLFVKEGGTGAKNGSSWDAAFATIPDALSAIGNRTGRIEIWVSEGTYLGFNLSRSQTSIYGGFSSTGNPNSINGRDLSTKISRVRPNADGQMAWIYGQDGICRDAIMDGFHINKEIGQATLISQAENATVSNFWYEGNQNTVGGAGLVAVAGGDVAFDKVYIRENYSESYTALYIFSGGRISISNSEITSNSIGTGWGSAGILNEYGGSAIIRNSKLYKNAGGSGNYQIYNYNGGLMDIDQNTIQAGRAGVYPTEDSGSQFVKWGAGNITY
ncbi:MAG: hypothetical protein JWP91_673 [Fibrobacteres bacterium]|nr:hypothetical protein [Fibrobacterota bacterium]